MINKDLGLVTPTEPYNTIQAAITAASVAPGSAVLIPTWYTGTDTYTNPSNVLILDMRGTGTIYSGAVVASKINSVIQAVAASAAAPITAAAGGTFVTTLNLPGVSAVEQVPFTVKATGYVSCGAGTYTATIQPLLYASTTAGFTAAAANAVYSVAAVNVTNSAAAAKVVPWEAQATIWGDTTSGLTLGTIYGGMNNGAQQITAVAAITNPPTAVNFAAAIPLQFAAGVTLTNAPATSIINLGSLFLEI